MLSKKTKMLRLSALSLAVAGAMSFSHAASAEGVDVSGSVGVANMYLWRGENLGGTNNGSAAVSGSLQAGYKGAYAGMWGSSGDTTNGTELDFYTGYGTEFKGFSADLSVWNYYYPNHGDNTSLYDHAYDKTVNNNFGGLSETVLSLGYAGFTVTGYKNIAGDIGYSYYTLAYSYKAFTVLAGKHEFSTIDAAGKGHDMVHVDVSYAYNDNLTFTLSQQVDNAINDRLKFVVAYSLPIGK